MPETRTIAFVTYPGLTALDLVGPIQVFVEGLSDHPDLMSKLRS